MTAGRQPPAGLSIIEQMAVRHHEKLGHLTRWDRLSKGDRQKLIDAMEAAVGEIIPDELLLKSGMATATVNTGEGRDGLLADLRQAKRSILSGQ